MVRRLRTVAILALLSLLLLEVVLQLGALAVAMFVPGTVGEPASGDRTTVLCVGDSFTYGLGASSHDTGSYPAQLAAQLESEQPGRWRVVNEGYPGRNSRQILVRLAAQLERHHPNYVLLLVGLNDRWSRPALLDLEADPDAQVAAGNGFRFEFRTLRLWRWLRGKLASRAPTSFAPSLASDDPARVRDAATRDVNPPSDPGALAARVDALDLGAPGSALPDLRAAARARDGIVPLTSLRAAVLAFALTGARERFGDEVRAGRALDPKDLHTVLESLSATGVTRNAIADVFAEALGWRHEDGIWIHPETSEQRAFVDIDWQDVGPEALAAFDVHRAHLIQAVGLCRNHGAIPLILGYPNRTSFPDEFLADIATAVDVDFLSTVTAFESRLASDPQADLFVSDGHCTDLGYGLMAQVALRRLLRD